MNDDFPPAKSWLWMKPGGPTVERLRPIDALPDAPAPSATALSEQDADRLSSWLWVTADKAGVPLESREVERLDDLLVAEVNRGDWIAGWQAKITDATARADAQIARNAALQEVLQEFAASEYTGRGEAAVFRAQQVLQPGAGAALLFRLKMLEAEVRGLREAAIHARG